MDVCGTGLPSVLVIKGLSVNAAELEREIHTCNHCRFWQRCGLQYDEGECVQGSSPVRMCKSTFGCRSWEPEDL